MTDLIMPSDDARVPPLPRSAVNPYVLAEYDKSIHTWGIPNNLIRTMACLPSLALTEVDYANSFIFDEDDYALIPDPTGGERQVLFPKSGFVDRVTKELVINLVGLINKSRYSITHHSVIGFAAISAVHGEQRAEEMLFRLTDERAEPTFEHRGDLYSPFQIAALNMAVKLREDAHDVSDGEFDNLRALCRGEASQRIIAVLRQSQGTDTDQYRSAFVNGMLVELTWCTVHFAGLLNKWFTVLKIMDETDEQRDGVNFVKAYNETVPERIKVRNNAILAPDGWGGNA